MDQNISNIITKLDVNKNFLEEVQSKLRSFVTDKKYPLEERFRVWKEYCDKSNDIWTLHKGQFGIIGDLVNKQPDYYDRGRDYDYQFYLDQIEEANEDEDEKEYWVKSTGIPLPSVNEFKESLIETNFGCFTFDW